MVVARREAGQVVYSISVPEVRDPVEPQVNRLRALLPQLNDELAHERHVFDGTPEAIVHARLHAARQAHEPTAPGV